MEAAPLDRILLVEDDLDIQMIAQMTLEATGGFTVKACSGGHEALRDAPEFRPELILLDVMMPDMDGPTTLEKLRELPETRDIPVVFMTAKVQQQDRQRYFDMGAIGVIPKPFDTMALAATVREIWAEFVADAAAKA